MDAVKNCKNCYWNAHYNVHESIFPAKCSSCSNESCPSNPYPQWVLNVADKCFDSVLSEETKEAIKELEDVVNHPKHYTKHPSGVECIQVTEYMNFCLGNAMKYIWRANDKHDSPLEDLRKAKWYIEREIARLEKDETV